MAIKSGFFDSMSGDRKYTAGDFGSIFEGVINDGVFSAVGERFRVSPSTDQNTVQVGTGRAWIKGTWIVNDGLFNLVLPSPEASTHRIDTIVLEANRSESIRAGRLVVISGTPHASNPARPTITSTATVARLPIAHIRRRPNISVIPTADITYVVGTAECPFVTGPLQTVNVSNLYSNWGTDFNDWMNQRKTEYTQWYNGLTDLLSEDAETRLAAKVSEYDVKISNIDAEVTEHTNRFETIEYRVGELDDVAGVWNITYVSGITATGLNKIDVRGGALYVQGTFRFDVAPTAGETSLYRIVNYPSSIISKLRAHGWTSDQINVGTMVCPANDATMMLVGNDTGLYMGYRTAKPAAGSWITMVATGMVAW